MRDLFICHSSADSAAANEIVDALEQRGVTCWMAPRDVPSGSEYQAEIVAAIEDCRGMLVLLSDAANESKHVLREITLALDHVDMMTIPVRLADVKPKKGMAYYFTNAQWVEYFASRSRAIDQICRVMAPPGAAPAPGGASGGSLSPSRASPSASMAERFTGIRKKLRQGLVAPALNPLYLLMSWRGRINRRMFFLGAVYLILTALIMYGVAFLLVGVMGTLDSLAGSAYFSFLNLLPPIFFAAALTVLYAAGGLYAKRLHDLGLSAWWNILVFLFWSLATLLLLIVPGKKADNRYGAAPSFRPKWRPVTEAEHTGSASPEYNLGFLLLMLRGRVSRAPFLFGVLIAVWTAYLATFLFFAASLQLGESLVVIPTFNAEFFGDPGGDFTGRDFVVTVLRIAGLIGLVVAGYTYYSALGKRLHDLGFSAGFALPIVVALISLQSALGPRYSSYFGDLDRNMLHLVGVGLMFLCATPLMFIKGNPDFNRFGPPPGFRVDHLRVGRVALAPAGAAA